MASIVFSLIPDAESDFQMIEQLMSDFKRETGIEVQLKHMEWNSYASHFTQWERDHTLDI